jgi:hypothetical protein
MTTPSLLSLFTKPQDLLALTPEDVGGAIIEVVPPLIQNGMFNIHSLVNSLYQRHRIVAIMHNSRAAHAHMRLIALSQVALYVVCGPD